MFFGVRNRHPVKAWEDKEKKVPVGNQAPSLDEFLQNTTFHGIKYIFIETPFRCRKVMWFLAVVAAIIFFAYQVGTRMKVYFEFQTTVNVEMKYTDSIDFPAVTLCNQNSYRETVAVEMNAYDFINELYQTNNMSAVDISHLQLHHLAAEDLVRKTSHQLEDFIESCKWMGMPCNLSEDFSVTLTDIGVCYTFNVVDPNTGSRRRISEPGAQNGLRLVLNVEQYEYMRGPQIDVGIKMLLHEPGTVPLMKNMGFAAAPGTHTLVAIHKWEMTYKPHPYGKCIIDGDPIPNCFRKCQTRVAQEVCDCRDVHMPPLQNEEIKPICNLTAKFQCAGIVEYISPEKLKICHRCAAPCFHITYDPSLSYAHLSKFNIDRLALTNQKRKEKVQKQFLKAREVSQKVVRDIVDKDKKQMSQLLQLSKELSLMLQSRRNHTRNLSEFSKAFNLPDILMKAADFAYDDRRVIFERTHEIRQAYFIRYNVHHQLGSFLSKMSVVYDYISKGGSDTDPSILDNIEMCLNVSQMLNNTCQSQTNVDDICHSENDLWIAYGCADIATEIQTFFNCTRENFNWIVEQNSKYMDSANDIDGNFKQLFSNTSYDLNNFPGYLQCLHEMNSISAFLNVTVPATDNLMQAVAQASDLEELLTFLNELSFLLVPLLQSDKWSYKKNHAFKSNCDERFDESHIFIDLSNCTTFEKNMINHDHFNEIRQEFDFVRQNMFDAKAIFLKLSESILLLWELHRQAIIPMMNVIEMYQLGNTSKFQLAKEVESIDFARSLAQISSVSSELKTSAHEFTNNINKFFSGIIKSYSLLFDNSIPVLTFQNYTDLLLLQKISETSHPDIFEHLSGANESSRADIVISSLETVFKHYVSAIDSQHVNVVYLIEDMIQKVDEMKDDLASFQQGNIMNWQFYMDNFLQIDIFYRELSYQRVQQMPAFELLSLYSEVGGFLGLLLGASLLTVCELIDYVGMKTLRKWHKQKSSPSH